MFKNIILKLLILFISLILVDTRRKFMPNMNKHFKNVDKYCSYYALNKTNINDYIINEIDCKINITNYIYQYNKKFINNCVNNITKYNNFLKIKNNCINKKDIEFIKSIYIILYSFIILPILFNFIKY